MAVQYSQRKLVSDKKIKTILSESLAKDYLNSQSKDGSISPESLYIELNHERNTHDFKMWRNGQHVRFVYELNAFKRDQGGGNAGVLTIQEMMEEVDGVEVFLD